MSCSNSSKKVAAKISLAVSTQALSSMTGGLVVFGKNTTTNDTFVRVLTGAQSSIEEELTVGTWDLGAMGWDGSSHMTGSVFCAQQAATSVTTGPVVFNLSLSNAACFGSSISPETGTTGSGGNQKFAPIHDVVFCSDDLASLADTCTYTFGEPSNSKVPVGSYSIDVTGVKSYKGMQEILPTEYLRSYCFNANSHVDPASESVQSLNIPRFNPGSGLSFRIVAHMSNDCSSGLNMGQISIPFRDSANFKASQAMSHSKFFVGKISIDQICSISNQLNITEGVASGTGDPANPYLICNVNQFYSLQRNFTTYYQKSFLLGKDIDLLYGVKAGSVGANPFSPCLEDGDTFIPIGYQVDPGTCDMSVMTESFSGSFDGNNKKIRNFRFKKHDASTVGLFAKFENGGVVNLSLEDAEIEGGMETGTLAGTASGTIQFKNIKLKNINLRANGKSGGVFGDVGGGLIENIHLTGGNLRAGGNEFGGIAGVVSGATVSKISFDGHIDVEYSSIESVGGLVGNSYSAISESSSTGSITGQLQKAGGIAGLSSGSLDYVRSDILIFDRNGDPSSSRYLGGLIGFNNGGSVNRSFFYGDIQSPCIGTGCNIGSILGSSGTVDSYSRALKIFAQGGQDSSAIPMGDMYYNVGAILCTGDGACKWAQPASDSDVPRLAHENHICKTALNNDSISAQRTAGRGPATNPFIICRPSQMELVHEVLSSEYVKLASNINLYQYSTNASILNSFPLVGKFDGQDRMVHSLNSINTNEGGVFGNISSSGVVKNLVLKNINIANCTTCKLGTLSSNNNGEIYNVRVHDSYLASIAPTAELGGLVSFNTPSGKIINSEVNVNIVSNSQVGGVASKNSGLIELVDSRSRIDINTASASNIGGIVGQLEYTGKIRKSEFGGEILLNYSATNVGGIVGAAVLSASGSAEISDVNTTSDAHISLPSSGGGMMGGILGNTSGSGSNIILRRAINSGNISIPLSNSISSIGGIYPDILATVTPIATKNLVTPMKELSGVISASGIGFDAANNLCSFDIVTPSMISFSGVGGLRIPSRSPAKVTISFLFDTAHNVSMYAHDYNDCENYSMGANSGTAKLYEQLATPDTLYIPAMKSEGFDIVDMDNDSTDAERMYGNFLAFLQGTNPPSPPVWEMDEGEPRIFVFDK